MEPRIFAHGWDRSVSKGRGGFRVYYLNLNYKNLYVYIIDAPWTGIEEDIGSGSTQFATRG